MLNQRATTLADAAIPGEGFLRDAALILGASLFLAIASQIAVRLPFSTVPVTAQTLAVLLIGAALGPRRGAAAVLLYLAEGVAGFPVFAPGALSGAFWTFTSGGYLIGMVPAAYVVGALAERGWDRGWKVAIAMVLGDAVVFAFGLAWLAWAIDHNWAGLQAIVPGDTLLAKTLAGGLWPFIPGDAVKVLAAAGVLPGAWALLSLRGKRASQP